MDSFLTSRKYLVVGTAASVVSVMLFVRLVRLVSKNILDGSDECKQSTAAAKRSSIATKKGLKLLSENIIEYSDSWEIELKKCSKGLTPTPSKLYNDEQTSDIQQKNQIQSQEYIEEEDIMYEINEIIQLINVAKQRSLSIISSNYDGFESDEDFISANEVITSDIDDSSSYSDDGEDQGLISNSMLVLDDEVFDEWIEQGIENSIVDLSDEDDSNMAFYNKGLEEVKAGRVRIRKNRYKNVGCKDETEYLAKVYCIRIAFNNIVGIRPAKNLMKTYGVTLGKNVLEKVNQDHVPFMNAYRNLLKYLKRKNNGIEEDLKARNIEQNNLFDVALDFFILDALDEVSNPPQVLSNIIDNTWLPTSVMNKSLSSISYGLICAKINLSKNDGRFMSFIYPMLLHIIPYCAGGFMGIDPVTKDLCGSIKDEVNLFVKEIFSFSNDKYKSPQSLELEILRNSKRHFNSIRW